MSEFGDEIGRALRHARVARGLTLREVSFLTQGRFKATSVAGYERGERAVTVERFVELCSVYGVAPQAVLAEIARRVERGTEAKIDLTRLNAIPPTQRDAVYDFVQQVRERRHEPPSDTVVIRGDDLDVIAIAAGTTREELEEALDHATRRE